MVSSQVYEIRQQIVNHVSNTEKKIDVSYQFTYNGHVTEKEIPTLENRAWVLTNRKVLHDTSGVVSDVNDETVRFWLPYTSGVTGTVYSGRSAYTTTSNQPWDDANRYCGCAGIFGATEDYNDPAAAWAPMFYAGDPYDMAFVHQAPTTFVGKTYNQQTGATTLRYWLRKVRRSATHYPAPPLQQTYVQLPAQIKKRRLS